MGITKIGEVHGQEVFLYTLDNNNGLRVCAMNYGGIIQNIFVRGRDGNDVDVVLGRDNLEEYLKNDGYYGAAIGRHANRIAHGVFELNGETYHVGVNEGENSLHGGCVGFDKKVWTAKTGGSDDEPSLELSLESPDGEEGFPGTLQVHMTYGLTKNNALKITYRAVSDKDTVVNLTNHSYFNLGGHASGDVLKQILQINSGFYTPNNEECMPTGEVLAVGGTPFDFRVPKPIGQDIDADFEQIQMFGGYDHNFALNGRGYRLGAIASCVETGIVMAMYTDSPAMQLYTMNSADKERVCKDGVVYGEHHAFCLETQCFPNAMAHSHYPSPILRAGESYSYTTEYRFSIME